MAGTDRGSSSGAEVIIAGMGSRSLCTIWVDLRELELSYKKKTSPGARAPKNLSKGTLDELKVLTGCISSSGRMALRCNVE